MLSYGTLFTKEQSTEVQSFTDISNFELDILVPNIGLYDLQDSNSSYIMRRESPPLESIHLLFPEFRPKVEAFFLGIYDDVDRESNNPSPDT